MKNHFVLRRTLKLTEEIKLSDYLLANTELTIQAIHHWLECGGVWYKKENKGKLLRIRNFNQILQNGDYIEAYYDQKILELPKLEKVECLHTEENFGIYLKPANILSQGNEYSDHTSMLRMIERLKGKAYLIHRLDREVAGPIVVGHTKDGAGALSKLFTQNKVHKVYRALVVGKILESGVLTYSLDGKDAKTEYKLLNYLPDSNLSLVEIILHTGRLHQIRRHFAIHGFPIWGDPKYGNHNKNQTGMKLWAYGISLRSPFTRKNLEISYPDFESICTP
jgi:tRNA pseudouridine32 synthase/23S rRNA pseudouridine746 synthase